MKQCKCEHWQQCPVCMPHRFDAEGNRLPPEPTPLQAAQAQIKALTAALFQMQEAANALAAQREWVGLTEEDMDIAREVGAREFRRWKTQIRGQIVMPQDSLEWHAYKAIDTILKEKNT